MKTRRLCILFVLSLFMLSPSVGCQTISQTKRADKTRLSQATIPDAGKDIIKETQQNVAPEGMEGIARYYAKRFHGKRTSSGERYNSKKLTAAHPTLPVGTRVKVINLANDKSVTVRINDRCRNHEEAFIDLSREAARQLGFLGQGMANVRMIVIEEDDPSDEDPDTNKK